MSSQTGRIRHIMFYPVKSAAGIEVPYAMLTEGGLVVEGHKDHEFMIVSRDPSFLEANKKQPSQEGGY
mgnify:CR=1 FL=1